MIDLLSAVDEFHVFDVEIALDNHVGVLPNPFPNMDKSTSAICNFYSRGYCQRENMCPNRHIRGDRSVVCKHWLRGLCKKGDDCEFLHEYDMSKMPECYFYQKFGTCLNKECPFQHIDPMTKIKDCPWYDRGFCRHGPACRHRHTRRVLCVNYLVGFCPEGSDCKFAHPSFDLPQPDMLPKLMLRNIICHACLEPGHKSYNCPKNPQLAVPPQQQQQQQPQQQRQDNSESVGGGEVSEGDNFFAKINMSQGPMRHHHHRGYRDHDRPMRNVEHITCYKCGELGHFANRCPRGVLGFLHRQGQEAQQQQQQQQQQKMDQS